VKPSGVARGVEPSPDALDIEPRYVFGRAGDRERESVVERFLPTYYRPSRQTESAGKIGVSSLATVDTPPSSCLVAFLIILSVILPPIGIIAFLITVFIPKTRHTAMPILMASILGSALWGWGFWASIRDNMYAQPVQALEEYIEAQDRAKADIDRYLPILELKIKGYIQPNFPKTGFIEFTVVEHVMGPNGYLVEVMPAPEESRLYQMKSLWTDHTGIIHIGSPDGPRYTKIGD